MHVGDNVSPLRPRDGADIALNEQVEERVHSPAPTLHFPRRSSVEPALVTNLTTTSATTTTVSTSVQGAGAQARSDQDSVPDDPQSEAHSAPAPLPAPQSGRRSYSALRPLAKQGNPDAQADLALCYFEGRGVAKSRKKAGKWFQLAADQGNSFAQAWRLWHGIGTKRNLVAAVELYMVAATSGNAEAMWRLGLCYERGWCVGSDANIALQMFHLAAMKGNADGQFHLARSFYHGIGTPRSKMEAVYWFALSEGMVASAAAGPMRLLPLLEQALRDFDLSLQEDLPRIERFLAQSQTREPAPAPDAEGESPDNSDGEPVGRAADRSATPPSRADKVLPSLQELSEPSSTPSTESGHSGEADEADEADIEWQADLGQGNATFG